MTFWCGSGSGSADPCLWLMDPDPDPAFSVVDLQDANKKQIFYFIFSAYYFLKIHIHLFSKIKSQKESQNSRNQGFSYYFCIMIEGSRSGSIPLTNGSGSGSRRPKNMWIRWIRIRIRNTGSKNIFLFCLLLTGWLYVQDLKILASRETVEAEQGAAASSTVLTLHKKKPRGKENLT